MVEFGLDGKIKTSPYGSSGGFTVVGARNETQSGGLAADSAGNYVFKPIFPVDPATVSVTYFNALTNSVVTNQTLAAFNAAGYGVFLTVTADGSVDFTQAVNSIPQIVDPTRSVSIGYTPQQNQLGTDYKFNIDVVELEAFTNASGGTPFKDLFRNPEKPTVLTIPIDFTNSTLFGSGYDVNKLTQDGYPYGRLSGVSVSPDGVLQGNYSNGQTKKIAQIVLVDFISPTGLASLGNNQWAETAASGQPLVGDPGTGNRGVLQSSRVEDANVDLTQELVNMITQQRNYQANAQSIKTQDQIMQTLVNLR